MLALRADDEAGVVVGFASLTSGRILGRRIADQIDRIVAVPGERP
jgi:hypothetical protein